MTAALKVMERPMRRSRLRNQTSGVVGLLPQEEAAINRALQESLIQEKKKAIRHRDSTSDTAAPCSRHAESLSSSSAPHSSSAVSCSRVRTEVSAHSTRPTKRQRLHSPLSPSHSIDSLSSSSKPSSPSQGNGVFCRNSSSSLSSPRSVEGSLKLVLSTSSWSRSSSSSWSPTPEPSTIDTTSTTSHTGRKTEQRKTRKPKLKTTGKGCEKPKRGRPRKYPPKEAKKPTPKSGKGLKAKGGGIASAPKTYTKASLRFHGVLTSKRRQVGTGQKKKKKKILRPKNVHGGWYGSELDMPPLSPEAALVLHDHSYSGPAVHKGRQSVGQNTTASTDAKSSKRSSPYAAQRKFALNQAPATSTPTRPVTDEVETVSGPKEIPKTEDFINFLCLRGSDSMPKELEKFSFPWTQLQRLSQNGHDTPIRRKVLSSYSAKGTSGNKCRSRNVAKKLGETIHRSTTMTPYPEQCS